VDKDSTIATNRQSNAWSNFGWLGGLRVALNHAEWSDDCKERLCTYGEKKMQAIEWQSIFAVTG
jgi:hypothetical protein